MEKNSYKTCKEMDAIEDLRSTLYKRGDLIIQNNIAKEILLMSEELDRLIVNYYKKYINNIGMR